MKTKGGFIYEIYGMYLIIIQTDTREEKHGYV